MKPTRRFQTARTIFSFIFLAYALATLFFPLLGLILPPGVRWGYPIALLILAVFDFLEGERIFPTIYVFVALAFALSYLEVF